MKLLFHRTAWVTPEFAEFVNKFEEEFVKQLAIFNGKILDFHKGHYYFSGYFEIGPDMFYFCWHNGDENLRYHSVRSMKDFTGTPNQYIKIEKGMVEKLCKLIKELLKTTPNEQKETNK